MGDEPTWPPKSAYEALISSPNGRQKVADFRSRLASSPVKSAPGTPSLLDRLRLARHGEDGLAMAQNSTVNVEEEDDEETLQLKLAAIEARIKLKKLQKGKIDESTPSVRSRSALSDAPNTSNRYSQIEVPLSPSKRSIASVQPISPNRVILGIDKGRRAAEVSLRRARTTTGSPVKSRRDGHLISRSASVKSHSSSSQSRNAETAATGASFSERMARSRETDKVQAAKHETSQKLRKKNLGINAEELEQYKAQALAADKATKKSSQSRSAPSRKEISYSRAEVLGGGKAKSKSSKQAGDPALFEGYSGTHLISRILPHSFLKRTLPEDRFTLYTVPDLLRNVISPIYELPDDVCDFVVFGVIASKSQPLESKRRFDDKTKASDRSNMKWEDGLQNQKKFMVFTITDLKWTIDLFLFETAVPRYHRLTVGTVVAIVNPTIMRPKRGQEDTGAFSMSLHNSEDTVLEIGQARDLGYCKALKKDGSECKAWVNSSKTEICEFHLNQQIAMTQSQRMGVNAGANGFGRLPKTSRNIFDSRLQGDIPGGGKGLLPAKEGRFFDLSSESHYYIAASSNRSHKRADGPQVRSGMSAAAMLDNDIDDPFLSADILERDKDARLRKRLVSQEKERQIAKQLGKLRNGTNAGAEYMQKRTDNVTATATDRNPSRTAVVSAQDQSHSVTSIADLRSRIGRKRAAQDIQLSPVKKKTRFLTSTGIKEAGRESMGAGRVVDNAHDDDDDDDLDII